MKTNNKSYIQILPLAQALERDNIKTPQMRAETYIQEAWIQHKWSIEDKESLLNVGLQKEVLDTLPLKTEAFQEAQIIWEKADNTLKETAKKWSSMKKEAVSLRKEMLNLFRFAYRDDESLLKLTAKIAKGNDNADLAQDMNDILVVATNHIEPLIKAGFKQEKLNRLNHLSSEVPDTLAIARRDRNDNPEKKLRDRFYTLLKLDIDEIRRCGKFAFANNKEHLKRYQSNFIKEKNNKSRRKNRS